MPNNITPYFNNSEVELFGFLPLSLKILQEDKVFDNMIIEGIKTKTQEQVFEKLGKIKFKDNITGEFIK